MAGHPASVALDFLARIRASRMGRNGRLSVGMEFSRETVGDSFEVQHRPIEGQVMVPRILVAAFALALALVPLRAWAQLPPHVGVQGQMAPPAPASMATEQERAILLEFFTATGGARWKQTYGWNTASDPCEWQGVLCLPVDEDGLKRQAPIGLSLVDNGLTGAVPLSLFQLRHLKQLQLAGNQITAMPQEAFARADANRLELWLTGNPIPELLTRVTLRIDSYTGMCTPGQQVQFAAEFDSATRRARYQAMFCPRPSERDFCLADERHFASNLDLVSRRLRRMGWKRENQHHHSPMGISDHEEHLRATLVWGDGTSHKISISGGQAPIDILIGQQLIRSLVWPAWTTTARRVNCDTLRW
jgi:hypothetical protein